MASKWHLQALGNGMGRSIEFGMLFGAILPPTWVPLGSLWASVGPHWAILATPEPHWPPFDPNFDPIGPMSASRTPHSSPFELHSCPRSAERQIVAQIFPVPKFWDAKTRENKRFFSVSFCLGRQHLVSIALFSHFSATPVCVYVWRNVKTGFHAPR